MCAEVYCYTICDYDSIIYESADDIDPVTTEIYILYTHSYD